ncbi:P-loop containing nucleoside triphosphate hydrolase protein [Haematococcus lacustris]
MPRDACRRLLSAFGVLSQTRKYASQSGRHTAAQQTGNLKPTKKLGLQNVSHIVAVTSAKGGVGKSTTAVNLAVAMATLLKLRVGLLDGDVHGPSLGKMMGLAGEPALSAGPQPLMLPKDNWRVRVMSFAFFAKEGQAVALRGPMVNSAFDKMAWGTDWGPLDVLVLDMPPGTGDAQINLGQRVPLSGAIVVSTPQDIALLDAKRGVQLFQKLGVPLLGMVENMSYHQCSACGHKEHTFGEGGVTRTAEEYGLPVLGQIPLDISIRVRSDSGAPVVVSEPSGVCAQAYFAMARAVYARLQELSSQPSGPTITID